MYSRVPNRRGIPGRYLEPPFIISFPVEVQNVLIIIAKLCNFWEFLTPRNYLDRLLINFRKKIWRPPPPPRLSSIRLCWLFKDWHRVNTAKIEFSCPRLFGTRKYCFKLYQCFHCSIGDSHDIPICNVLDIFLSFQKWTFNQSTIDCWYRLIQYFL